MTRVDTLFKLAFVEPQPQQDPAAAQQQMAAQDPAAAQQAASVAPPISDPAYLGQDPAAAQQAAPVDPAAAQQMAAPAPEPGAMTPDQIRQLIQQEIQSSTGGAEAGAKPKAKGGAKADMAKMETKINRTEKLLINLNKQLGLPLPYDILDEPESEGQQAQPVAPAPAPQVQQGAVQPIQGLQPAFDIQQPADPTKQASAVSRLTKIAAKIETPDTGLLGATAGTLGRALSLPGDLIYDQEAALQSQGRTDPKEIQKQLALYEKINGGKPLEDVKVRLGNPDMIDDWKRTWENKRTYIPEKLWSTVAVPGKAVGSALGRVSYFDPYTNVVNLYGSQPTRTGVHLGRAVDFNSRSDAGRMAYGAARPAAQAATLGMSDPVGPIQYLQAHLRAQEANSKASPEVQDELTRDRWRRLAPRAGGLLGGIGGAMAGALTGSGDKRMYLGGGLGVLGGAGLGRLVAELRNAAVDKPKSKSKPKSDKPKEDKKDNDK